MDMIAKFRPEKNTVVVTFGPADSATTGSFAMLWQTALEVAREIKLAPSRPFAGWLYEEAPLKVGKAQGRIVFMWGDEPVLAIPESAADKVAEAIAGPAKLAEHWETLNTTKKRERLYEDQQSLMTGRIPLPINLGVPKDELRKMKAPPGVESLEKVGYPTLIKGPSRNGQSLP